MRNNIFIKFCNGGDFLNINKSIDINIEYIENLFKDCNDIVKRKFPVGKDKNVWLYIIYIDDMTDRVVIDESIMNSLMIKIRQAPPDNMPNSGMELFNAIKDGGVTTADIKDETDIDKAVDEVLMGNTIVLIDGCEKAIIASTKGFPSRGVNQADTEVVVQGSKDSFSEGFRINTVLVRRRIRDTKLKMKQLRLGRRSKTDIALVYLEDVVREEILAETEKRINEIDIDAIIDSGYVEQLIQDDYLSPFPQIQLTERPDKAASAILEGRIVIIVDNTPFVLIVPAVMASFYQSAEDYVQRWEIMSFVRVIRYIASFFAVALPGLYISLTIFHPSMLPLDLLLKMTGARQGVPMPTVVEIIVMELAFETLREAGIRLPSAIGSTLGIVGGIIIGQSAVEAGLVSPMVVIVVAATALCSFSIPNIALVSGFRLVKYFIIIMSSLLGLFGFWSALIIILIHLVSLKSFSIPYIFPFAAVNKTNKSDKKDTFLRLPIFMMKKRPIFANPSQKIRMDLKDNVNKRRKE